MLALSVLKIPHTLSFITLWHHMSVYSLWQSTNVKSTSKTVLLMPPNRSTYRQKRIRISLTTHFSPQTNGWHNCSYSLLLYSFWLNILLILSLYAPFAAGMREFPQSGSIRDIFIVFYLQLHLSHKLSKKASRYIITMLFAWKELTDLFMCSTQKSYGFLMFLKWWPTVCLQELILSIETNWNSCSS